MVDRGVFSRFRQQRDLTAYYRRLAGDIEQWPALRAAPQLLRVALPIASAAGALVPLRAALAQCRRVTLAGASGSGRGLAMRQLALYHARRADAAEPLPALLDLPTIDDGRAAPAQLLDQHLADLLHADLPPRGWRPPGFGEADGRAPEWLLFVQGWEQLAPARRMPWQQALAGLATRLPPVGMVVALPAGAPAWDDFQALRVLPPPPALLTRWVQELCPAEAQPAVQAALLAGGQLERCAERLLEVALVCWLAARFGVPATRAALYQQTLAALADQPALLAGSQPAGSGHAQLRRFTLARQLVDGRQLAALSSLPAPDQAETALLAVELTTDVAPLLTVLWRTPDAAAALTLGRCLRSAASAPPIWTLRVATRLARLARASDHPSQPEAAALLSALLPALDAALAQLTRRQRPVCRLIGRLLRALPPELAIPRAARLALDDRLPPALAWAAADIMAELSGARALPLPPDGPARARWTYIRIVSGADVAAADAHALLDASAGATRLAHAGEALALDPQLPAETRVAGIALLEHSAIPRAAALIWRACEDSSAVLRRSAHAALMRLDPATAQQQLAASIHDAQSWELRLEAIESLAALRADDAARLMRDYALDPVLPLAGRLLVVERLGAAAGPAALLALADDQRYAEPVRASALWAATGAADHARVAALLAQPDAPAWFVRAICGGLATRGRSPDRACEHGALAHLRTAIELADLETAHTALGALGAVGGPEAAAELARLLAAGALEQRLAALAPELLDRAPDACLADTRLPAPLRLPLETALARGLTYADRPSTLREFLTAEVDLLRAAVARALGILGGPDAAVALVAALHQPACEASRASIAALGAAKGLDTLVGLLAAPLPQGVRWQVVRQIACDSAGEAALRAVIELPYLEAFTRGAAAEALGQRGARSSLLTLTGLLREPAIDPHVLAQAVSALGALDEPAVEPALLRIVADTAATDELRGRAAASMPRALSEEARQRLRETLRLERAGGPVVAGALQALGRARDRETLTLAMRYCLDDRAEVVRAAIGALADIGEDTVTPILARTAQNPNVDHVVRIQAAGALLRLGGGEHQLLLRPYLEHSSPLLQLRALDALIAAQVAPAQIAALALDQARALPLRLRAIEQIAEHPETAPALVEIAARQGDEPQLRRRAALALGALRSAPATPALCALAEKHGTDSGLRYRSIEALGRIGGGEAWAALSRIAESQAWGAIERAWAAQALRAARESQR